MTTNMKRFFSFALPIMAGVTTWFATPSIFLCAAAVILYSVILLLAHPVERFLLPMMAPIMAVVVVLLASQMHADDVAETGRASITKTTNESNRS